jgi:hypothetical protein
VCHSDDAQNRLESNSNSSGVAGHGGGFMAQSKGKCTISYASNSRSSRGCGGMWRGVDGWGVCALRRKALLRGGKGAEHGSGFEWLMRIECD